MREAANRLLCGRASPRNVMSGHLPSHSNSFGYEMEKDTAGDRVYHLNYIVGGMTSFYLNVAYPDLFAASLFVGSQWDNTVLNVLERDKFFYIVSAGDEKTYTGQTGLMSVFDQDNIEYTYEEWSAQESEATQNANVEAMIEQGLNANFITFTKGTTVEGGTTGS